MYGNLTFKKSNVLEFGISDHHSFITIAVRIQLIKADAKMKMQKYYKTCNTQPFKRDLRESLENIPPNSSINMRQYRKKIMRFNIRFSDVFRVNKRRPETLLKKDSNTVVFLRILQNF